MIVVIVGEVPCEDHAKPQPDECKICGKYDAFILEMWRNALKLFMGMLNGGMNCFMIVH